MLRHPHEQFGSSPVTLPPRPLQSSSDVQIRAHSGKFPYPSAHALQSSEAL